MTYLIEIQNPEYPSGKPLFRGFVDKETLEKVMAVLNQRILNNLMRKEEPDE